VPRLRYIEESEIGPAARQLMEYAETTGTPDKRVVSIFTRTQTGTWVIDAWVKLCFEGVLPNRLKEMCRIRISELHHCGYCSTVRSKVAQAEGLTEEMVSELWNSETSDKFTPREKAALRLATKFKESDDAIDDDALFDDLKAHFSEEEIIELGILCALTDGLGKFTRALNLVTWEEACEINPSLRHRGEPVTVAQP
jgi:AhpD family alkylhydroperoxidase